MAALAHGSKRSLFGVWRPVTRTPCPAFTVINISKCDGSNAVLNSLRRSLSIRNTIIGLEADVRG